MITLVLKLDLYQTWPHDSPVEGEEPYLFWVITIIPFDNLYRLAYFVMHTFLVIAYYLLFVFCSLTKCFQTVSSKTSLST